MRLCIKFALDPGTLRIWIFLLNVVHSEAWNQYTAINLVHFQYTFKGKKKKNPSRSVSRGVE